MRKAAHFWIIRVGAHPACFFENFLDSVFEGSILQLESQIASMAGIENISREAAAESILRDKHPSRRSVAPADIGALVVFLCAVASAQITGAALAMDGGWTAQ